MRAAAILLALAVFLVMVVLPATAAEDWQLQETRYCGQPARNADGTIKRSRAVLAAFKRLHPCPATGDTEGPCPGWSINHVIPLACGGCDSVANLDWMPAEIKSCSAPWCRDRWERKVYAADPEYPDTAACKRQDVSF